MTSASRHAPEPNYQARLGNAAEKHKPNPVWRESDSRWIVNEHQHFTRFKRAHRDSMSVAKIDQTRFTKHNGNGGSLAAKTLQETVLRARETWWERTFKWEKNLTVGNKTIEKGWVVPQPLGIALILLILTGVGTLYWTMSARIDAKDNAYQEQRDMIIEMKTRLEERTTAAEKAETKRALEEKMAQDEDRLWRETMGRRMDKVELARRN